MYEQSSSVIGLGDFSTLSAQSKRERGFELVSKNLFCSYIEINLIL